ncbi:MAG: nucleoside hydrolase [Promethearchaeota archaeon]
MKNTIRLGRTSEHEGKIKNLYVRHIPQIIIDTDCALGKFWRDVDDGLALVMALNSVYLKVLGITTTYGNASLNDVNKHTNILLEKYKQTHNRHVPSHISGADKPLHKLFPELKKKDNYNGFIGEFLKNLKKYYAQMIWKRYEDMDWKEELSDGAILPKKYFSDESIHKLELIKDGKLFPAIKFMKDIIEETRKSEEKTDDLFKTPQDEIYLVPIGPLTNITLLLMIFPRIFKYIDGVHIMGGKLNGWEFNFANDPIASKIILKLPERTPIKIKVMGLEVCTAQFFSKKYMNILKNKGSKFSQFLYENIRSWFKLNRFLHGFRKGTGFYPFDPTAILSLIRPNYLKYKKVVLDFRIPKHFFTANPKTKTMLLETIDEEKEKANNNYIEWATKIDSERFLDLLISRLE